VTLKKILIVTDAWHPQINGVVRTLEATAHVLKQQGHEVCIVGPDSAHGFTLALPFYPSIQLTFFAGRYIRTLFDTFQPDFIHIATEGPLGWSTRRLCLQRGVAFTTSYHTRFPEYLAARLPAFLGRFFQTLSYSVLRRFHALSSAVMVATPSLETILRQQQFSRLVLWSRGVDDTVFQPIREKLATYDSLPRPLLLYVGRVAVEKNIRDFLNIKTEGTHIIIGDGPDVDLLSKEYPNARFLAPLEGRALAHHYAAADLFVFPSMTETFGLVLLEACACGLRIASFPAPGPLDLFSSKEAADFVVLNSNLETAVQQALLKEDNPSVPHNYIKSYSWEACTKQFFDHIQAPLPEERLTSFPSNDG